MNITVWNGPLPAKVNGVDTKVHMKGIYLYAEDDKEDEKLIKMIEDLNRKGFVNGNALTIPNADYRHFIVDQGTFKGHRGVMLIFKDLTLLEAMV